MTVKPRSDEYLMFFPKNGGSAAIGIDRYLADTVPQVTRYRVAYIQSDGTENAEEVHSSLREALMAVAYRYMLPSIEYVTDWDEIEPESRHMIGDEK